MNMGLKRKLSFEDSASLSPPASTPATSLPSSSQGSSAQPQARPELPGTRASPLNSWNIAGAPYFNSRTRKRLRDSRPPEDAVHERTLQKLYSAQKPLQQGAESDATRQTTANNSSPDTPRHQRYHANAQLIAGPPALVEIAPERNQRSIDVFFPGSRPSSTSIPQTTAVLHAPLPSSIYQPNETAPSLIHTHPHTLPSVLTCEDCYAPLLTKLSGEAIDAEMLDVDMLKNLVDPEMDEGWQCAVCAKRTCDACAVRGDYRVCLECAVPGGGGMKNGNSIRRDGLAASDGCDE